MPDVTGSIPGRENGSSERVAPGVARLGIAFVNAYLVGAPDGPWALSEIGLPLSPFTLHTPPWRK